MDRDGQGKKSVPCYGRLPVTDNEKATLQEDDYPGGEGLKVNRCEIRRKFVGKGTRFVKLALVIPQAVVSFGVI
jgi:hypothetical protein